MGAWVSHTIHMPIAFTIINVNIDYWVFWAMDIGKNELLTLRFRLLVICKSTNRWVYYTKIPFQYCLWIPRVLSLPSHEESNLTPKSLSQDYIKTGPKPHGSLMIIFKGYKEVWCICNHTDSSMTTLGVAYKHLNCSHVRLVVCMWTKVWPGNKFEIAWTPMFPIKWVAEWDPIKMKLCVSHHHLS